MCYTIIVKRESDERLREVLLKNQRNLKKPLDKPHKVWYNIRAVRERELQVRFKKNLKKLKKRLDKSLQICYNKYVIKRDYKANY